MSTVDKVIWDILRVIAYKQLLVIVTLNYKTLWSTQNDKSN